MIITPIKVYVNLILYNYGGIEYENPSRRRYLPNTKFDSLL